MKKGERFSVALRDLEVAQCLYCKHLLPDSRCEAFPDGIPEAILNNTFDHRQPYPGDHGILFEPAVPAAAQRPA